MKIFLVCTMEGNVIDVVSAKTFEEVYMSTIGLNNGELLVEIDKQIFKKIKKEHTPPFCPTFSK